MMNNRNAPLVLAIFIHISFLVLLSIDVFFNKKEDLASDKHIFELASIPNVKTSQSFDKAHLAAPIIPQPVATKPLPEKPETSKSSTVKEQKKIPSLPPSKPVAPKKEVTQPIAKKTLKEPIKMTKEDFDRLNPGQNRKIKSTAVTSTSSKSLPYIPVETKDLEKDLASLLKDSPIQTSTSSANGSIETLAIENYKRAIKPKIERAWQKPSPLSVVRLNTVIQFDLLPSGEIVNLRVIKSSGDTVFDNSVIKAFRNVNSLGKVPYGSSLKQLRLTFEVG